MACGIVAYRADWLFSLKVPQMTQAEIQQKSSSITARLIQLDAEHLTARKIIEAELLGLRHICQHPNMKVEHSNTWGRWESTDYHCPDCGFTK